MKHLSLDISPNPLFEFMSSRYKHVIAWLCFIVYEVSLVTLILGKMPHMLDLLLHYPLYIALFYYHCFYVLNSDITDDNRNWKSLIAKVTGELIIFFICGALISFFLQKLGLKPKWIIGNYSFIYGNVYRCIYILGGSTAFWFALYNIRKQKRISQMQQDSMVAILEKENLRVRTEAALQKATVNPHMLFNNLTFLYGQVRKVDKSAAENIMSVSELMHFALLDSDNDEGIMLEDELTYIEHYIRLHKQRIPSNITMRKEGTELDFRQTVIPLLLVTIVENVLQHGNLSDPGSPALVRISCTGNVLEIRTQNLIGLKSGTGHCMGLANLQKRLEYTYSGAFRYSSHVENNCYKTFLKIHLDKSALC